ncbi:MAG: ATP synthase F1 subunit epsilon [Blastocatellia bacterium]|nr:ATP synthase F1 subunit epsilon [Blastocatellia bacterium]MBL8193644.1 ATP synthase F1 subunit epsilon [Blastocatellia bacterium]MBN8723752.1 ATP synthase F1 subunit epsilon [Acidobacteriota bacterium]
MAKLKLEIITPERLLLSQEVTEVQIPTLNGEVGILPGHTSLISKLAVAGILKYRDEGKEQVAVVGSGFVEIYADKVTILSSLAEKPQDINLENARRDLATAEQTLKLAEKDLDINITEALANVERATIRVQAAQNK